MHGQGPWGGLFSLPKPLNGLCVRQMEALMACFEMAKEKGHDVQSLQDSLLALMLKQHTATANASVKIEEIKDDEAEEIMLDQSLKEYAYGAPPLIAPYDSSGGYKRKKKTGVWKAQR